MHQQIQIIPHMEMAQLQRPRQRHHQRRVQIALAAEGPLLRRFVCVAEVLLEDGGGKRFGRDAAGERGVVVDVEFEEVEEGVRDVV